MTVQDDESRTGQLMEDDDGDLTDMLGELRVLLPTAQLLSAFLIAVPFAPGFRSIVQAEKNVFLATFMLSVAALVLFTAPAVQHRLMRPLRQRANFKARASRQMLVGAASLAIALVLATQFVLSEVLGHVVGNIAAAFIGALIGVMWLLVPLDWNRRQDE
ncbi:DUF6328 family protein [Roseateles puraquae]|uniref:Sodium:proton antiporter n=1 Tax=Roseateles puraquae TaxID=431059 RepID=A0A254N9I1_9BURK|nr:DUF6328 family protein [Roseateles puraquae]MDG0857327.1 hypothetical protein [Roseateles puraquae]OWR02088.1 hypothetical protein CDO81_20305 [Roseateles puraquae]RTL46384.1 MAG: hypothetical protein EKK53_04205 [Burkholderiales bacterium]